MYAPRSAPSAGATSERSSVGTFWRVSASATGPPSRSSAIRHAIEVSFASPGRTYQRFGIARSAMWCSTGWCVGPSSPSADRVVRPDPERLQVPERREPDGRPHVVGEDQERRAVRLQHPRRRARSRSRSSPSRARGCRRRCCGRRASRRRRPPPSNSVFVDSTRSAAPPTIVGVNGLNACITVLPASRVATSSPAGNPAAPRASPAAACRCGRRPSPRAAPGTPRPSARSARCHSRSASIPRRARVHVLVDLVGDVEVLVGVEPERLLRRAHLVLAERRAVRLRGVDRVRRADRRCGCGRRSARARLARPARRGSPARARRRPRRRRPAGRASRTPRSASPLSSVVNVSAVVPSIVMWLSS